MSRETEKIFKFIQREIEKRGLTDEKEINEFIKNNLSNINLNDFDLDEDLSDEDLAIDIVEKAKYEEDEYEAISLIEEALSIDKDCIDAYALLATKQSHPFLTEYFLKEAIKIGKRKFSNEFLEENKEHLWAIIETRPFLRAMSQLAHVYYTIGDVGKSTKILERIITICPSDNLGIREMLFTQLLSLKKFKKAKKYLDLFEDDALASTLYSRVFYSFYSDNDLEKTLYLLKAAQQCNPNIIKKILSPTNKFKLSENYTIGSPEEANYYCYFAKEIWQEDPELIHWLKQNQ